MADYDPQRLACRRDLNVEKVPLLQIFGATPDGVRESVIVHGVFPTIHITCPQNDSHHRPFFNAVRQYLGEHFQGEMIFDWSIVVKKSIYGYNEAEKFMELQLLSHERQQNITDCLSDFVWQGKKTLVFDGRIPMILQFLSNFNLTGCGQLCLRQFTRLKSKVTRYETDVHCKAEDIICEPLERASQILSHLNVVWEDQREIRRRMNIESQAVITSAPRGDLLFTQRPIEMKEMEEWTEEEQRMLECMSRYDPDATMESAEKEILQTQKEVASIMEERPAYQTPDGFVPGRLSVSLPHGDDRGNKEVVVSWATRLVTDNCVLQFQHEKPMSEVVATAPEMTSVTPNATTINAAQFFPVFVIEIGSETRKDFKPDPTSDPLVCVAWALVVDQDITDSGVIYVSAVPFHCGHNVRFVENEKELFTVLTELIRAKDPDVIGAYDNEREGFTYLDERATALGIVDWLDDLARTTKRIISWDDCRRVSGRVLVNFWRIVNHKVDYRNYSLTTVSEMVLKTPFPEVKLSSLTGWLKCAPHVFVDYYMKRLYTVVAIINRMCMIDEYCELATVVGADFCSCLSRGSQFLIESLLSRVAWRKGYILYSPTKKEVSRQRAPICFPLVMEPISGFYADPVMVVDFQSLYPSAIIAYNLCYSTTFGHQDLAAHGNGQLGALQSYDVPKSTMRKLLESGDIINTPNDVLFVKQNVRKGILPILLDEILSLRAFVKQTLKVTTDPRSKRVLEARQLALKLFAACTYGYTSAHWTGRMPCVDVGDSIVECSRNILEFVLHYIETDYPELTVLYGDTDSLFIKMPQGSKEESFKFAEKLCDKITSFFPHPVRIKLEKIFYGCFLVNKKRYVGWMYESAKQAKPELCIKGLEMKRRDSCVLVAKVMTEIVESMFRYKSIDKAKEIFDAYIERICRGKIPLNEYMFAREVRLGAYKSETDEPPSAVVARRRMAVDPRDRPLFGERIQYLVVASSPGARLIDRVVYPEEFLSGGFRIDTRYYIERQVVPALGRMMETVGVDINTWMLGKPREMPKLMAYSPSSNMNSIERFCKTFQCPLCLEAAVSAPVCAKCLTYAGREGSLLELIRRIKDSERVLRTCAAKCANCISILGVHRSSCFCAKCPVFWQAHMAQEAKNVLDTYLAPLERLSRKDGKPK